MKTLVFIPMYNCEKQIQRVLAQFDADVLNFVDQIIVVNNRSTDDSEKKVIEFKASHPDVPVLLLRNRENYSLGGSHKVAFNYAIDNGFDFVVVLHGDDQGDIHDLIPYLKNGEAYKYDSFLGSRFEKGSKLVNYSSFRIFGNHVFNAFVSMMLCHRITDLGSGLNMYKTEYLKSRFYMDFINTLTFNVYLLIYGVYSKSDFTFFPLTWREEDQISNAKFVKQSKEILKVVNRYRFHKNTCFTAYDGQSAGKYLSDIVG